MGKCFSKCFEKNKKSDCYQRMGDIFPFPCPESGCTPSDKNDEKFFYIKNEQRIDWVINHLDELSVFNEKDVMLLEQTLAELKNIKNTYTPILTNVMMDDVLVISQDVEDGKVEWVEESQENSERLSSLVAALSDKDLFKQGTLIFEIQKANFLHSKLLEKYQLKNPFVLIKLYLSPNRGLIQVKDPQTWVEVKTFETLRSPLPIRPQWDQSFEYYLEDPQTITMHAIGISLFYISGRDNSTLQIGEEQIFSLTSLLDQKVQSKQIDFKDPVLKGVLAKLRVRFQLLYNLEELRKRTLKDIKARMEKLLKIRRKYSTHREKGLGDSTTNSAKLAISRDASSCSASSTHENEENIYYVGQ